MSTAVHPREHKTSEAADLAVPALEITSLRKHFALSGGRHVAAVDDISLTVQSGELVVLLGPSGCGKTTLLRCVAGLEAPDDGRLEIAGTAMFDRSTKLDRAPEKRRLSMVFQTYALWPHMTAAQNVAYPLKVRGRSRAEIRARVAEVLSLVGVSDQSARYPSQMSGGQQQRVALARALAPGSELVLFDEPLSNIDAKVREALRLELLEMQRNLGFSALYVTHDQDEAMQLAHRIVVLKDGKIEQTGRPDEIYEHPVSLYVSRFIGQANEVAGTVRALDSDHVVVACPFGTVRSRRQSSALEVGAPVVLVARPEQSWIAGSSDVADPADLVVEGAITAISYAGTHREVVVRAGDDHKFLVRVPIDAAGIELGQTARVITRSDRVLAFSPDEARP